MTYQFKHYTFISTKNLADRASDRYRTLKPIAMSYISSKMQCSTVKAVVDLVNLILRLNVKGQEPTLVLLQDVLLGA